MYQPQRPNKAQVAVSKSYAIPASTKGWMANQNIAKMDEEAAVVLDNFFPETSLLRWRRGSQIQATLGTETTPVETVMVWQGGTTSRLFGCVNGKIYNDASGGGTISTTAATGLTSNQWQWLDFSTPGGQFLVACNGADAYRQYDGTTWTTTAITGPVAPNALIQIFAFKQRLFFVEKGTADAWYLPVNSITGAAAKLPLGSLFVKGGVLQVGATWTHDAGVGPQDYCVFISSEGEVIVYSGTDPASATTWSLVGRFQIGRPIGRRCTLNVGSDLIVLCADGVMPLSKAIQYDRAAASQAAFTWNIQSAFQQAYASYAANFGWQIVSFTGSNMALINIPVSTAVTSYQYVMNVLSGAWCRYKGLNASCWVVMRDALYFGGMDGKIYQAETGSADVTTPIEALWISAYNDLGRTGLSKSVRLARPVFITDPAVIASVGVCIDYDNAAPTNAIQLTSGSGVVARWDVAHWDVDVWPVISSTIDQWLPVSGEGYQVAATVYINLTSPTPTSSLNCEIAVFNVLYEPGGFI